MLQTIIQNQSSFRKEVFEKFEAVEKRFEDLEESLTARIDKVGKQLAYLEDDAPTKEEFENLEKKVDKLASKPRRVAAPS